jgi:hypothetical protein
MTDDFRSPYEIEDDKNSDENLDNQQLKTSENKVDSLVDNDVGAVTMGSGGKKKLSNIFGEKFWSRGLELWPSTQRQKIIGSSIAAALIVLGGGGIYALSNMFKTQPQPQVIFKEEKNTEPSKLTGVEVSKKLNKRPVTAVMIENSPDARPQAGLYDAGIVFEAIAEGGITRFCALFQEAQPGYIGPVRSIRPYYVDLFMPFDASIVHAGGSAEGLAKVARLKARDIDHGANADAFQRVSDRYAPHNLYTSMKDLDKVNERRGYKKSDFTSLLRKWERPSEKPSARIINFNMSGDLYNAHFQYDAKHNDYKRSQGGLPHRDHKSGKTISPKVVIALVMRYSQSGIYSVYKTNGKGAAFIFQDGEVTRGTWKKSGTKKQFVFVGKDGQKIRLNPGQTWITLVSGNDKVSYKP